MPADDGLGLDHYERRSPIIPTRDSQTQSKRSTRVKRIRSDRDRSGTRNWCRNASTSSGNAARERTDDRIVKSKETRTDIVVGFIRC